MHSKSLLLMLSFLFTSLLTPTTASPLLTPLGAEITSSAQTAGTKSSQLGTKISNSVTRLKNKLKEEMDGSDLPDLDEKPHFPDLEPSNTPETSELEHFDPDSPPKCPVPLSTAFTARYKEGQGHGCKKIAQKFGDVNSFDQFYCQPLRFQARSLCGGGFDAEVADCLGFLENEEGSQAGSLLRLGQYSGLCARIAEA